MHLLVFRYKVYYSSFIVEIGIIIKNIYLPLLFKMSNYINSIMVTLHNNQLTNFILYDDFILNN